MLIQCPECELPVSEKAISCPHCGYPMKISSPRPRKTNRRRRLPNGFGQISEIKGRNLRKPFRVMITVGKTETGRPICKPLKPVSFFETYNDAYSALVDYNKNPYSLDKDIKISELYDQWSESYYKTIQEGAIRQYKRAWKLCSNLYNMKVTEIKIPHIKACMKEGNIQPRNQAKIKTLFSKMLDYAMEYDIVDRNVARSFVVDKETSSKINKVQKGHMIFSDDELNILWNNLDVECVDMILIQCYSGWRPSELCDLKISDVDLVDWTFKGGMKTEAGKNRVVPIHTKIRDLIKHRYDTSDGERLFSFVKSTGISSSNRYRMYSRAFSNIIESLKLDSAHTPHDCRKTFVSLCKKYNVDEYAIKYLVGHTISDLTENTYTEREPQWFHDEIEKIV